MPALPALTLMVSTSTTLSQHMVAVLPPLTFSDSNHYPFAKLVPAITTFITNPEWGLSTTAVPSAETVTY